MNLEKGRIKEFKPVRPSQDEPAQEISGNTVRTVKLLKMKTTVKLKCLFEIANEHAVQQLLYCTHNYFTF